VEEPCDINLVWSALTTKADASFNNATSDGISVFCSDNQAIHSYDLLTGGLNWSYSNEAGFITAGSMRNNITITGDAVYASGGTASSFFKLDKATGALIWSRSSGSPSAWRSAIWLSSVIKAAASGPLTLQPA
jgi:outer membrane protein assembly factor BamB